MRARRVAILLASAGAVLLCAGAPRAAGAATVIGPADWPMYGHDPQRSFVGTSTLTSTTAAQLAPAWFFSTGDAVTAQPIVVNGTVYVGSWDGSFYALDEATGSKKWSFTLDLQPAVTPQPGNRQPQDATTDGGIVTSTAFYEPGGGTRPDLVIFGGGFTLYALDASTGALYWKHVYSGRPEAAPDPADDQTRIFSSPAVVGNAVLFSVSPDGETGYRGYLVAADIATGNPLWRLELDGTDATGAPLNDGCGGVWGSPSIDLADGIEVVGTSDCRNQSTTSPHAEHVLGVRIGDGSIAWEWAPPRLAAGDPPCDFDFGATPNLGSDATGALDFIGVGGKDGTYYSLDPHNPAGPLRWARTVVFGGGSGGFLGSAAYDGAHVYGGTAIGDFTPPSPPCEPANPQDTEVQEPSFHTIDAGSGAVTWEAEGSQTLGATSEANGMTFAGAVLARRLFVDDAATGTPVAAIPGINTDSGAVLSGNAVFVGIGSSDQGTGDGVLALTPLGVPPQSAPPVDTPESPATAVLLLAPLIVGIRRVRHRRS